MKLLHIDSDVLGFWSVSCGLSAATVACRGEADVTYRDLAAAPLPHLLK